MFRKIDQNDDESKDVSAGLYKSYLTVTSG
jgi:hypothetical protein